VGVVRVLYAQLAVEGQDGRTIAFAELAVSLREEFIEFYFHSCFCGDAAPRGLRLVIVVKV